MSPIILTFAIVGLSLGIILRIMETVHRAGISIMLLASTIGGGLLALIYVWEPSNGEQLVRALIVFVPVFIMVGFFLTVEEFTDSFGCLIIWMVVIGSAFLYLLSVLS